MDEYSWAICNDNVLRHNKLDLHKLNVTNSQLPQDGDIVGVAYDHIQLKFFVNGKEIEVPITNVKGTVFPALYGIVFSLLYN